MSLWDWVRNWWRRRPPPPPPPPPGGGDLVAQANLQRSPRGLPPLLPDAGLEASARAHVANMARAGRLYHQPGFAENVAYGQRSAAEAVTDWMGSPGHRANLLSPAHRRAGGGSAGLYWCMVFSP